MHPAQEWRNVNATPRFDESARMAADMWAASGRGEVDGVLAVDVVGLENLLELVGPVEVTDELGTTELSADNVARVLLFEQYAAFAGDQDVRRDRLGTVTQAIFSAFNERSFSTAGLIRVFHGSGRGRNLLLWSADADQQEAWDALDTSGAMPADAVLMSLLNREGNKLDQFVEIDAHMSAELDGDVRHVSVAVTLRNTAPDPLPAYIAGTHPRASVAPGDYGGVLALTIPGGAGSPTIDGKQPQIVGNDGPVRVVGQEVVVPRGKSVELVIEFDLSTSWTELRVMPSARVPGVSWTAGGEQWRDRRPRTVDTDDLG
jgi:hypothetical protein